VVTIAMVFTAIVGSAKVYDTTSGTYVDSQLEKILFDFGVTLRFGGYNLIWRYLLPQVIA